VPQFEIMRHLLVTRGRAYCDHGPNAFSKKLGNHALSVALHYMHYNFCRIHKTLRITPAMAAGVTDKLWSISDIVQVLEDWEAAQ
jgi:hypothetical protein